jgi:hypothetical protein
VRILVLASLPYALLGAVMPLLVMRMAARLGTPVDPQVWLWAGMDVAYLAAAIAFLRDPSGRIRWPRLVMVAAGLYVSWKTAVGLHEMVMEPEVYGRFASARPEERRLVVGGLAVGALLIAPYPPLAGLLIWQEVVRLRSRQP